MKFGNLIKQYSWPSVEIIFTQLYQDQVIFISDYERVFNNLRIMIPSPSTISIIVTNEIDDFDLEEYVSISGYDNSKLTNLHDDLTDSLALEFTSWNIWLGMDIDNNSLETFSPLEIICHCLHEMTFLSFSQDEIENELNQIKKTVDDIKHLTDSEKKKNLFTLDEIKRQFNYKNKKYTS